MKVLITGCTGFIGLHLTRFLLDQGHDVVGLVRTPSKLTPELTAKMEVVRGDLSVFRDHSFAIPEVDVVVHLAAVIAGKNEQEYASINYDAVVDMLSYFRSQSWQPQRFVFASSLAAAGPSPVTRALTEEDPPQPIDPYGAAKAKAEALMAEQPFPTTSFRPPIVLGPGDPASLTLYKMAQSGFAALPAGAPQRLSFVFVDDLVRAIALFVEDTSKEHRVFFTTHQDMITNEELLRTIASKLDRRLRVVRLPRWILWLAMKCMVTLSKVLPIRNQLDAKQYKQMTAPAFACNSDKLAQEMGWVAETDLPDAIEASIAGYRKLGQL